MALEVLSGEPPYENYFQTIRLHHKRFNVAIFLKNYKNSLDFALKARAILAKDPETSPYDRAVNLAFTSFAYGLNGKKAKAAEERKIALQLFSEGEGEELQRAARFVCT